MTSLSTDGAEMGKLMAAGGLGVPCCPTQLLGDPLGASGLITQRPLAGDDTSVTLPMVTRDGATPPPYLHALQAGLLDRARAYDQGTAGADGGGDEQNEAPN